MFRSPALTLLVCPACPTANMPTGTQPHGSQQTGAFRPALQVRAQCLRIRQLGSPAGLQSSSDRARLGISGLFFRAMLTDLVYALTTSESALRPPLGLFLRPFFVSFLSVSLSLSRSLALSLSLSLSLPQLLYVAAHTTSGRLESKFAGSTSSTTRRARPGSC